MKQSTDKLKKIFIAARIRKQLDGMPHGIYGKTGLAIVLIASIASGYIGGQVTRSNSVSLTSTNPSANRQVISSESELISQIADDVGKSVVSINVTTEETRRSYFGDQTQTGKSAGTGVIISDDGLQHLKMQRNIECVVFNKNELGNGIRKY